MAKVPAPKAKLSPFLPGLFPPHSNHLLSWVSWREGDGSTCSLKELRLGNNMNLAHDAPSQPTQMMLPFSSYTSHR